MKDTYEDKTKEQLIREVEDLRQSINEFEGLATLNVKLEGELKQQVHYNVERVKELNCLYGISRLIEVSDISLEGMLQKIVDIIPS